MAEHDGHARAQRCGTATIAAARAVAVWGASDRSPIHRTLLANLSLGGAARVIGVNRGRREACGVPCVAHPAQLPFRPDLAVLLVADDRVEAAVEEAIGVGAGAVFVPGVPYSPTTVALRARIAASAAAAGIPFLGPDCMGVAAVGESSPWLGTLPPSMRAGGVAVASQSGSVAEALIAHGGRLGLRLVVTVGRVGSIDLADACRHFASDPGTTAVGLFVEAVDDLPRLAAALAELRAFDKPVVCLAAGASEAARAAAAAHSGATPSDAEALQAALNGGSVMRAPDFATLVETLVLLEARRRPPDTSVAAVTNSGGLAQLLADDAFAAGIPFAPVPTAAANELRELTVRPFEPVNPLDAWHPADIETAFRQALGVFARSGAYGTLLAQIDQAPDLGVMETDVGVLLATAVRDVASEHELAAVLVSGLASEPTERLHRLASEAGIPLLRTSLLALRAIALVGRWAAASAGPGHAAPTAPAG